MYELVERVSRGSKTFTKSQRRFRERGVSQISPFYVPSAFPGLIFALRALSRRAAALTTLSRNISPSRITSLR